MLREPQRLAAEARVQSARAAVEQARVDLGRTVIRAPFDAQVLSREVEIGSQVSPGDPLARLVGVDRYWVEISLRWTVCVGCNCRLATLRGLLLPFGIAPPGPLAKSVPAGSTS